MVQYDFGVEVEGDWSRQYRTMLHVSHSESEDAHFVGKCPPFDCSGGGRMIESFRSE